MRILLSCCAAVGLLLTIVPSILVAMEQLTWQSHADLMTVGMVIWFAAAIVQSRGRKSS